MWETFFLSCFVILASCFKIALAKFGQWVDISTRQWSNANILHQNELLQNPTPNRKFSFEIIMFYSTESVFKIILIVCIEIWEVYINFILSRFGIGCHLLAFSINMADVKHCTASPINNFEGFLHIFYCRIKNFTESLTEKLLHQVGWQGRVQNNRNSPHDVRSPECRVLTQTF